MSDSTKSLIRKRIKSNADSHNHDESPLLLAPAVHKLLGVSYPTMARWRRTGQGPRYLKVGPKLVFYYVADIEAWLKASERNLAK